MKKNVTKIALLLIAAVMLVSIAFAGAASADPQGPVTTNVVVSNGDWTFSTKEVQDAYLISSEDDWRYVVKNYGTMGDKTLVLTQDIVFTSPVQSLPTFTGKLYGNGHKFINLTQTGYEHGLIRYAGGASCELNYVQMTDSNISVINNPDDPQYGYNSNSDIGGLIGKIPHTLSPSEVKLLGCSVTFSNITLTNLVDDYTGNIGGLVGQVEEGASLWINASCVDHVYVSGLQERRFISLVGGLIGYVNQYDDNSIYIADTRVDGSEIYCDGAEVGGVAGCIPQINELVLKNVTVNDCKIWGKYEKVGGLIGIVDTNGKYDGCTVIRCTILTDYLDSEKAGKLPKEFRSAGGLFGQFFADSLTLTGEPTQVISTWINGTINYKEISPGTYTILGERIGSIIGASDDQQSLTISGNPPIYSRVFNGTGSIAMNPITYSFKNAFNDTKSLEDALGMGVGSHVGVDVHPGYRGQVYLATVTTQGPGTASASQAAYPAGATVQLTATPDEGYVFKEWSSTPDVTFADKTNATTTFTMPEQAVTITATFEPKPYGIIITNATGTYPLTTELTEVYGDYAGANNGTAKLSTDSDGNPVLTLDNFHATNTSNVPIIKLTDVPKLRIELKGESCLTASVLGGNTMGAVCGAGNNLIITNQTGEVNGKLIVTNKRSGDDHLNGICLGGSSNLNISHVNVTVFADGPRTTNGIYTESLRIEGPTTVVDAYAKGEVAAAIPAGRSLEIKSNCVVKAHAEGDKRVVAITSGNLLIDTGTSVEAYAKSSSAYAQAISSRFDFEINGATVNATADGYAGSLGDPTSALKADCGNITITGGATVEANASSSTGYARSIYAGNPSDPESAPDCSVYIDDESTVETHAKSNGDEAYAVWAVKDLAIKSAAEVNATAVGNDQTFALSAETGNITIDDAGKIEAHAASSHHNGLAMYAKSDVNIVSSEVNATAVSTAVLGDDPGSEAYALFSGSGNIFIKDATVDADAISTNNTATAIQARKKMEITATNLINAHAKGKTMSSALGISSESGNLLIDGDSTITAIADGEYGIAIDGFGATISIQDCEKIIAEGTNTSFGVLNGFGSFDISKLENTHKFLNASTSLTYDQLCNDWHVEEFPIRKGIPFNISNYTAVTIEKKPVTPSPTPPPSHRESGQTVIQQSPIQQDVSKDPTPANQATSDVSAKYVSQTVIGTSASDVAAIKQVSAEAAAQMEVVLSTAQAAGIPLTNSKGAKAVVVTSENIPNVEKVTFSRVYEISPVNEGEKLTKVTVKVPKTDVTSKGLTSEDVTVYHYLESYNLWVPLETISISSDADNYYYTAATDGTSPFGVLVKKIGGDETATPTTQPTQTQKSPAPFVGLLTGLGAALMLIRMRR